MSRFAALDSVADIAPGAARSALRDAVTQLSERGLSNAAHWYAARSPRALELLHSLPKPSAAPAPDAPRTATPRGREALKFPTHSTPALNAGSPAWEQHASTSRSASDGSAWPWHGGPDEFPSPAGPGVSVVSPSSPERAPLHVHFDASATSPAALVPPGTATFATEDAETYALAKSCLDQREYDRCAWLLEKEPALSDKGRFLQLYARFLVFQRELDEEGDLPPLPYAQGTHEPSLVPLLAHLVDPKDAFLLFLKGVIFSRLHKRVEAMDCLLTSLRAFPYNWSAWQELGRTLDHANNEREQILDLLPDSFMSVFFLEYATRQATQVDASNLERIDALLRHFPGSTYLLTCRAQTLYLHQELEEAADTFQEAMALDPYRLEGVSEYSNTLYVLDHAEALAQLVQQFARLGKDRPEVCCLIGNYYNQRSDHFRAIESFKRALRLDSEYVAAWILLGHEYLELKNSHAAAEMYRRALEINAQDYRPWHGLGQVYELNEAWSYAIHYYQKCAAIRPYDARMWASLGVCYDRLGRTADAIACFKRHLTCPLTEMESVDAIARIVDLYEREGDTVHSTLFHCLLAQVIDRSMPQLDPVLVARYAFSFVIAARYEMGDLQGKLFHSRAEQRAARSGIPPAPAPAPRGDLALAQAYLQKVIAAGTEMTLVAEELLKKLAAAAPPA
ncbi:Anaphase-promoting complex subunit 8 [Malassezia obtusa]|uniref:Anaphase-promoting complex subunit 8 n=1 Tax=Malassezia obtusa TaxID=76774 RepID=A0AAF0E5Q6_9BASI|nr:Anaphase-promoting complex subunit 8 [Malassezia obtusa]